MIHHIAHFRKSQIAMKQSTELDAHVIQLTHPGRAVKVPHGYISEHTFEFVDDVKATRDGKPLSIEQAKQIIEIIRKIEQNSELLQLTICCDTGRRPSATLTKFVVDQFPHIKCHQRILPEDVSWNMYATLSIAFNGFEKYVSKKHSGLLKNLRLKFTQAFTQSPRTTVKQLKTWFFNEF